MEIDINDVAGTGSVYDSTIFQLPPETWSEALNMRPIDGGLESLLGWTPALQAPTTPPHFVMPVAVLGTNWWLYTSLTHAVSWTSTAPTSDIQHDVTRAAGPYSTLKTEHWNGTYFAGIPVLNNQADVPQYWSPENDPTTRMKDLPNWPPTLRCRRIIAFGPFLVAVGLIETASGTKQEMAHTIQWSHPAAPGALPPSWDYTNPATDAGRKDFPDFMSGELRDALPLGSTLFLYEDNSTWKMRFVGGRSKFDTGEAPWLTTSGILAPRCVTVTGDGQRHVVATQDDIIWHNGNTASSILNKRQRRKVFAEMDDKSFVTSFMYTNPTYREVRFCYPTKGNPYPNKELILNYGENETWVVTEADGVTYRNASTGTVEGGDPADVWNAGPPTDTWNVDTGPWSDLSRRRVLLADPTTGKLFLLDAGNTRDGIPIVSRLRREGLSLLGKKRGGAPIVDHQVEKMLRRVWPKITGNAVIQVAFGAQQVINGPTYWTDFVNYDPLVQVFADPGPVSGRAVGLQFKSEGVSWRIDGYKIDVVPMGQH